MPLVLVPALPDLTREQLEAHIEQVRARRMVAAVEYTAGKNAKLTHESEKIQRQVKDQYTLLGKEIERLDKALERVESRMITIETMNQEIGIITGMLMEDDK